MKVNHHLIILLASSVVVNIYLIAVRVINFDEADCENRSQIWMLDTEDRFPPLEEAEDGFYPIDEINATELNPFIFYDKFVSRSIPVLIRGLAKDWKAMDTWNNETYMKSVIGEKVIEVERKPAGDPNFAYFLNTFGRENMTYSEFLEKYKKYETSEFWYYWAEKPIPEEIKDDVKEPEFSTFMNLDSINIWQGAAGTVSLSHTDDRDNILCQVVGTKNLVIIPPSQRFRLYIEEGKPPNYSPVDFFNPDYEKYPDFKDVVGKFKVSINSGDALFIPAYWWHIVKSSRDTNIAVNFWYLAHHLIANFMTGIEDMAF